MSLYHVYLIVSERDEVYIGYSQNLRQRLAQHNSGHNRSTRARQWTLVYAESFLSEEDARNRERRLKQDGRARYQLYKRVARSRQVAASKSECGRSIEFKPR